jgi:hypothetical protein
VQYAHTRGRSNNTGDTYNSAAEAEADRAQQQALLEALGAPVIVRPGSLSGLKLELRGCQLAVRNAPSAAPICSA